MHAKLLMLALFFLVLTDAQSCIGFSKGSYSGDVTSQDECRTACETAEGFCCPDFKTLSNSNKTYYKCSCVNNQQGTGDRRSICEGEPPTFPRTPTSPGNLPPSVRGRRRLLGPVLPVGRASRPC